MTRYIPCAIVVIVHLSIHLITASSLFTFQTSRRNELHFQKPSQCLVFRTSASAGSGLSSDSSESCPALVGQLEHYTMLSMACQVFFSGSSNFFSSVIVVSCLTRGCCNSNFVILPHLLSLVKSFFSPFRVFPMCPASPEAACLVYHLSSPLVNPFL